MALQTLVRSRLGLTKFNDVVVNLTWGLLRQFLRIRFSLISEQNSRVDESQVPSRRSGGAGRRGVYLEERSAGLGSELLDDVERTASLVHEFPNIGRRIDPIHRQLPLQRFSYYLAIGSTTAQCWYWQ